jgi:ectoine hydroxylase-related dioxygenase (phytanoyl-CoA dioxygenase family)
MHTSSSNGLFATAGYVIKPSLLDTDALDNAKDLLMTRKLRLHELLEEWLGDPVPDNAAFARRQAEISTYEARGLPKDLRHYLVGEFDLETRLDPRICGLLASPKVRAVLSNFLGTPKYYVHYPPMVRFKMADVPGSILPAHQDSTYNSHLRNFITVWVPLVDIDNDVGGLILYDGSHRDGMVDHVTSGPWAHGLKEGASLRYFKHPVHMRAGDALFLHPLLIHESAPHLSPTRLRYSIDFRVFTTPEDTTKSYFDPFEDSVMRRG